MRPIVYVHDLYFSCEVYQAILHVRSINVKLDHILIQCFRQLLTLIRISIRLVDVTSVMHVHQNGILTNTSHGPTFWKMTPFQQMIFDGDFFFLEKAFAKKKIIYIM